MVNIEELKRLASEYDTENKVFTNYKHNREVLKKIVEDHGVDVASIVTGLSIPSINQHMRNRYGTAMISNKCIKRAQYLLSKV